MLVIVGCGCRCQYLLSSIIQRLCDKVKDELCILDQLLGSSADRHLSIISIS